MNVPVPGITGTLPMQYMIILHVNVCLIYHVDVPVPGTTECSI
jgi:hypothetical protein